MNKKIQAKIKKIANLKAKIKELENEVTALENEVKTAKDKEFSMLSRVFFTEENADKKSEIEKKIKSLIRE